MLKSVAKQGPAPSAAKWPVELPHGTLKTFKDGLAALAMRLPRRAQHALIEACAQSRDYAAFQKLARACGVREIGIHGEYGLIEGSIDDDAILPQYARTKSWSAMRNQFFADFFAEHHGGTYLDIGANLGLTTIPIARNPSVSCKLFEPEPANFRYLRNNIARNCPHGNVELFNLALFDKPGTLELELSRSNMGDHRIRVAGGDGAFGEGGWPVISIKAERLDDVLDASALTAPIAAKIIAQGAESYIIAGGRSVLSGASVMVFEFYPYGLERLASDVELLIDFIIEHFDFGDVMLGNEQRRPAWEPVFAVTGKMRRLATPGEAGPYDYYHIFLRK